MIDVFGSLMKCNAVECCQYGEKPYQELIDKFQQAVFDKRWLDVLTTAALSGSRT
jgi:hypothetical protein